MVRSPGGIVTPGPVAGVVPGGVAMGFEFADGRVRFTLPRIDGHAMIEIA